MTARLLEPGRAARTLKVTWSGRSSALSGKLPKLKLGKKGATLVIVTREAAFAIGAAETSLSFAARGSALMRASSRSAALRSGIGQEAASATGRRERV